MTFWEKVDKGETATLRVYLLSKSINEFGGIFCLVHEKLKVQGLQTQFEPKKPLIRPSKCTFKSYKWYLYIHDMRNLT